MIIGILPYPRANRILLLVPLRACFFSPAQAKRKDVVNHEQWRPFRRASQAPANGLLYIETDYVSGNIGLDWSQVQSVQSPASSSQSQTRHQGPDAQTHSKGVPERRPSPYRICSCRSESSARYGGALYSPVRFRSSIVRRRSPEAGLRITRRFGFLQPQAHDPFQGSTTSRPQSAKSATLRVASLAPRTWAIAAICASAWLIGRPSARR